MDYFERLHHAIMKEKLLEKFLSGKISESEMEEKIRIIGKKIIILKR